MINPACHQLKFCHFFCEFLQNIGIWRCNYKTDEVKYNGHGKRGKSTDKSDKKKNFCKRDT
jgi:hypothetical protein